MKSLPMFYKTLCSKLIFLPYCVKVVCQVQSSKKLKSAFLLFGHCPIHSSTDILKSKDAKVRAVFLPKNTAALIQAHVSRHYLNLQGLLL
jgi:hypothetical protein